MNDTPLISVIVPCYKVEQLLPVCFESLAGQSYPNTELIFIDDGSPDNCGRLLDGYALKDPRVKVIHQQNRGLSGARNAGLDIASGELIAFLDSDDRADKDWLLSLYRGMADNGSDIAVCGFRLSFEDGAAPVPVPLKGVTTPLTFSSREGLCRLIAEKPYKEFVWNKLFKRSLWEGVRFPERRNFEDVAIMYRLFNAANKVTVIPGTYVDYLQRKSSIIGTRSLKNEMDGITGYTERISALAPDDPALKRLLFKCFISKTVRHLVLVGLWNKPEKHHAEAGRYESLSRFLNDNYTVISSLCPLCDRLIVRLLIRRTLPAVYLAGAIAFKLRLLEKLGLKKEFTIPDTELTEVVNGK